MEYGINMYTLLYIKWINKKARDIAQGTIFNIV